MTSGSDGLFKHSCAQLMWLHVLVGLLAYSPESTVTDYAPEPPGVLQRLFGTQMKSYILYPIPEYTPFAIGTSLNPAILFTDPLTMPFVVSEAGNFTIFYNDSTTIVTLPAGTYENISALGHAFTYSACHGDLQVGVVAESYDPDLTLWFGPTLVPAGPSSPLMTATPIINDMPTLTDTSCDNTCNASLKATVNVRCLYAEGSGYMCGGRNDCSQPSGTSEFNCSFLCDYSVGVSDWSSWGECNATLGCSQIRTRSTIQPQQFTGPSQPSLSQSRVCPNYTVDGTCVPINASDAASSGSSDSSGTPGWAIALSAVGGVCCFFYLCHLWVRSRNSQGQWSPL